MASLCKPIDSRHTSDYQGCYLDSLLDALSRRFRKETQASRNLVSLLNALAVHLEMHFELEETDGLYENILWRAPRMTRKVDSLLQEHVLLISLVSNLVETAREALTTGSKTVELAESFDDFRHRLEKHEEKEREVLQESYLRDIGNCD